LLAGSNRKKGRHCVAPVLPLGAIFKIPGKSEVIQMLMERAENFELVARGRIQKSMTFARKHRWLMLFVLLPIALSTVYYSLVASDIYVSESRFAIKSPGHRQAQISALANIFQSTGLTAGQEQANEVIEYLRSRDALTELQKNVDVRGSYSSSNVDALSRFPQPFTESTFENLYKYYRKMVPVDLDAKTNVIVLEVRAFSPLQARRINERLLEQSEALVNRLNARAQNKAIEENMRQVGVATDRLNQARVALRQYRNEQELLDPKAQASGVLEVSTGLVAEHAALSAQLQQIERVAPYHPSIPALRARVGAISAQIGAQTGRAVGTQSGIASKLTEYERLLAEQEFATQMLTAANTTLEQSRAEAQKQQFYLERVVEPNKPDMPELPNRLWQILTIAAAAACLYMIGWMLIVGILEHAPED
jgi:capsular polysaccharide transport system permease protein